MMPRTPNFITQYDHSFMVGKYESKTLPGGSWVRPIALCYVPNDTLEDPRWKSFNKNTEVFCYTRYGLIPIPKFLIVEK